MSASVEASVLIQSIAGPVPAGTKVKTLIHRAARLLGWSDSRAFDVWYMKARRIDAEEMDALRRAARVREEDASRTEYAGLIAHLEAITRRLDAIEQAVGRASSE